MLEATPGTDVVASAVEKTVHCATADLQSELAATQQQPARQQAEAQQELARQPATAEEELARYQSKTEVPLRTSETEELQNENAFLRSLVEV